MKTLREILTEKCEAEGWGTDDIELEETLREIYPVVSSEHHEAKRWCDIWMLVANVDGRFFRYSGYTNNNENDAEGSGYHFEGIDNVVEVFPKEIVEIIYVTKDKLEAA